MQNVDTEKIEKLKQQYAAEVFFDTKHSITPSIWIKNKGLSLVEQAIFLDHIPENFETEI